MFYYIKGELTLIEPNMAVIDVGGVGYKLTISGSTQGKLSAQKDKKQALLYTYLAVKEDAIELYGFYTTEELAVFKMLIGVSGIGAKSAISVLTQLSPEKFALAVASDDVKAISKAPGVGAKTAARIVLELKDKVSKELNVSESAGAVEIVADIPIGSDLEEAQKALMVLGYTKSEVSFGLRGLESQGISLEDMIREALKKLMKS